MKRSNKLLLAALIFAAVAFALWKIALIEGPPAHCDGETSRLCKDLRP